MQTFANIQFQNSKIYLSLQHFYIKAGFLYQWFVKNLSGGFDINI